MTVRILLQARLGSTRLPGKVMLPLGDTTVIKFMLRRLEKTGYPITVCIPDTIAENPLYAHLTDWRDCNYCVFRGDGDDVLGRLYAAAMGHDESLFVRATADCPLIDPETVKEIVAQIGTEGPWGKIAYAARTMCPDGNDVQAFTRELLMRANAEATIDAPGLANRKLFQPTFDAAKQVRYWREHVCPWMEDQGEMTIAGTLCGPANWPKEWNGTTYWSGVKTSIDTQEDLDNVRALVARRGQDAGWRDYCTEFRIMKGLTNAG